MQWAWARYCAGSETEMRWNKHRKCIRSSFHHGGRSVKAVKINSSLEGWRAEQETATEAAVQTTKKNFALQDLNRCPDDLCDSLSSGHLLHGRSKTCMQFLRRLDLAFVHSRAVNLTDVYTSFIFSFLLINHPHHFILVVIIIVIVTMIFPSSLSLTHTNTKAPTYQNKQTYKYATFPSTSHMEAHAQTHTRAK